MLSGRNTISRFPVNTLTFDSNCTTSDSLAVDADEPTQQAQSNGSKYNVAKSVQLNNPIIGLRTYIQLLFLKIILMFKR